MTNTKLKFRASTVEGKPETLYYQIRHDRAARQISTRILPGECRPDTSGDAPVYSLAYMKEDIRRISQEGRLGTARNRR